MVDDFEAKDGRTMNRHAFRSVSRRARPAEFDQATQTLSSYFRQFSTSTQLLADEPNPSRPNPSVRQQSRAAADDIRALANKGPRPTAQQTDSNPSSQQPKVVDVKSLPRGGLRGRGGFRGRGGVSGRGGAQGGAGARSGSPNRFSGSRGAFRGRGQARGRGRGGKAGGKRKPGEEEDEEGKIKRKPMVDDADIIEPSQQAFMDAMRFGVPTTYTPSLTRESLALHMPPVASSSNPRAPAIHQSLSTLGTADRVGVPGELPPTMYALDLKEGGVRYFADVESKERTEAYLQQKRREEAQAKATGDAPVEVNNDRIISDAEDAIKKVVLDEAVAGQHQAPTFATDPVAVSRNWHLRAETWGSKETKAFEDKLTSMLERNKARQKKAKA